MARTGERRRWDGRAWAVVTVLAGLTLSLNAVSFIVLALTGRWGLALLSVGWIVASYWFALGAWLRTPWGTVENRTAPPDPPPLSDRAARSYIALAGLCLVAVTVALAVQVVIARS